MSATTAVYIPVLETERLRLRAWRQEDIDPYANFCADPAMVGPIGGPWGREEAWRKMAAFAGQWVLRGYGSWALEEKAGGRFVGYGGLWHPEGWPEPEIHWGLVKAFHGRGYATEAARRVRNYAYSELGWRTAISFVGADNVPSQRVALRLGATLERSIELRGHRDVGIYRHPAPSTSYA